MGIRDGHEAYYAGPGGYRVCDNLETWIVDIFPLAQIILTVATQKVKSEIIIPSGIAYRQWRLLFVVYANQSYLSQFPNNDDYLRTMSVLRISIGEYLVTNKHNFKDVNRNIGYGLPPMQCNSGAGRESNFTNRSKILKSKISNTTKNISD